jgi:hypothetical protein
MAKMFSFSKNLWYFLVLALAMVSWFSSNSLVPKMKATKDNAQASTAKDLSASSWESLGIPDSQLQLSVDCNIESINELPGSNRAQEVAANAPIRIKGWSVDRRMKSSPKALYLRVVESGKVPIHFAISTRQARGDVASLLNLPVEFLLSGFEVVVLPNALGQGDYALSLIQVASESSYYCSNGRTLSVH